MAISLDDIHFLTLMIDHHEAGAALAQDYLDTSSPAQRQSRIADLARTLIDTSTQTAANARTWLQQAGIELPAENDQTDNEDSTGPAMMDGADMPDGCNCGGMN